MWYINIFYYFYGIIKSSMNNIHQILESIRLLPKSEQEMLVNRINIELVNPKDSIAQLIEVRKELQEREKFVCPHCDSEKIIGHGNYKGRKRYKCMDCKKTFNDLTGTSVSWIHKKEEWKSYLNCIASSMTLRESAKQVGISFRTSFLWRHKIIGAFKDIGCTKFEGIVEGDETFFLFSEKGDKAIEGRDPRKRGGKASKAGINDEHVAVIVSIDRNKEPILEVACRGRISAKHIDTCIGKWLSEKVSVLCSDSHKSYASFAKSKELKHVQINASKGQHVKDKVYHIQNINNIHHLLKDWIDRFNGVASGYLQNYMNWFRILRLANGDMNKYLNFALTSKYAFVPVGKIKPQYIIS
jgi:transposase-like protein